MGHHSHKNIFIDLRSHPEYIKNHIVSAINIPLDVFNTQNLEDIFPKYYLQDIILSFCDMTRQNQPVTVNFYLIFDKQAEKVSIAVFKNDLGNYLRSTKGLYSPWNVTFDIIDIKNSDRHFEKINGVAVHDMRDKLCFSDREDSNEFLLESQDLRLSRNILSPFININEKIDSNNNNEGNNGNINGSNETEYAAPINEETTTFQYDDSYHPDFYYKILDNKISVFTEESISAIIQTNAERDINEMRKLLSSRPGVDSRIHKRYYVSHLFDFSTSVEPLFPNFMKTIPFSRSHPKITLPDNSTKEDQNTVCYVFEFDNDYTVYWNHIRIPSSQISDRSLPSLIRSIVDCMEPYKNVLRKEFGIIRGNFTVPAILCFLVCVNKWTVMKSVNYLLKRGVILFSPHLVKVIRILLAQYESVYSAYTFPSLSLKFVATYQLQMENFHDTIKINNKSAENVKARKLRVDLFSFIEKGQYSSAFALIDKYPSLIYARTSLERGDFTPLLLMFNSKYGKLPSLDELDKVTNSQTVLMTDRGGKDIINYTVNINVTYVQYFISKGAAIDGRSGAYRVPLQSAIMERWPLSNLEMLISDSTINHQDLDNRTPLHGVVLAGYPVEEMKRIITYFVREKGANMHIQDVTRETPMSIAIKIAENRPDFNAIVELFNQLHNSEGCKEEHGSFAPIRENVKAQMYVDGKDYFAAVAEAMFYARRCIYIADWWLTPDYQLIRDTADIPPDLKRTESINTFRLDNLLKQKAETGVEIYILIWNNVESAFPIKSDNAERYLRSLHSGIKVVRHGSLAANFYCWSHHQKAVVVDNKLAFIGGLDICLHRYDSPDHPIIDTFSRVYLGKDYFSLVHLVPTADITNAAEDFEGLNRLKHPRMPWHDVSVGVDGLAAMDIAVNFVRRWNFVRKSMVDLPTLPHPTEQDVPLLCGKGTLSKCQIVRSIAAWSGGVYKTETSIFNAMLEVISSAEKYIYIENQFFVSVPEHKNDQQRSKTIADAIVHRIQLAFSRRESFHVVMLLPAYPEGDLLSDFIHRVMYWQRKSLRYIIQQIKGFTRGTVKGWKDYLSINCLYNYARLNDIPVCEQIYVHSKLMVSDKYILCGSANINYRSLNGDRDSEIACLINNTEMATSLRKRLWAEHLGDDYSVLVSDNIDEDINVWKSISNANTRIYRNIFGKSCALGEPRSVDHYIKAIRDFRNERIAMIRNELFELISELEKDMKFSIRGHVTNFPLNFLVENVNATQKIISVNPYSLITKAAMSAMDHIFM